MVKRSRVWLPAIVHNLMIIFHIYLLLYKGVGTILRERHNSQMQKTHFKVFLSPRSESCVNELDYIPSRICKQWQFTRFKAARGLGTTYLQLHSFIIIYRKGIPLPVSTSPNNINIVASFQLKFSAFFNGPLPASFLFIFVFSTANSKYVHYSRSLV